MNRDHHAAIEEIRAATADLMAAAREVDTDRIHRELARRGLAVLQLTRLGTASDKSLVHERQALDDQAREALSVLTDLREGTRAALDSLSRSQAAIRGYNTAPSGGVALDHSA